MRFQSKYVAGEGHLRRGSRTLFVDVTKKVGSQGMEITNREYAVECWDSQSNQVDDGFVISNIDFEPLIPFHCIFTLYRRLCRPFFGGVLYLKQKKIMMGTLTGIWPKHVYPKWNLPNVLSLKSGTKLPAFH